MTFKNCAPFTKCITKNGGTTIEDAADLDFVMPMYNLSEYGLSYSDMKDSLWFYSKDESNTFNADIA